MLKRLAALRTMARESTLRLPSLQGVAIWNPHPMTSSFSERVLTRPKPALG